MEGAGMYGLFTYISVDCLTYIWLITYIWDELASVKTSRSHLAKRKLIFKSALGRGYVMKLSFGQTLCMWESHARAEYHVKDKIICDPAGLAMMSGVEL